MKILVDAYINKNFGDDLLIYELVRAFPEYDFSIFAESGYESIVGLQSNLHAIAPILPGQEDILRRLVNKARACIGLPKREIISFYKRHDFDVYMQYGGSIFMQATKNSWKNKVRDYRYTLHQFKKSAIVGCNFGPYFTDNFLVGHRDLFREFDCVTFRDTYSWSLFSELNNTHVGADIAFLEYGKQHPGRTSDYITICPVNLSGRRGMEHLDESYRSNLAVLAVGLSRSYCKPIRIISFCDAEGDLDAALLLKERIGELDGACDVHCETHESVEDTLGLLEESLVVVGSRFHAIMVSLALGIPTIPISYSKKIDQELSDLEYRGASFDMQSFVKLSDIGLDELINRALDKSQYAIGDYAKTAHRHFDVLKQVFSE